VHRSLKAGVSWPKIVGLVLAIALITGGVVAVVIFQQRVPPIPTLVPQANCASLAPSPSSVPVGSSGFILLDCAGSPAFEAPAGAIVAPSFLLSSPWVNLSVYPSNASIGSGSTCESGLDGIVALASDLIVRFPSSFPSSWNYCGDYLDAPSTGLPEFTVVWSTAPPSPTQNPLVVRSDFPAPCASYLETRHTGRPDSVEFWIYIETGNTHDLEGWAFHTVDDEVVFTFDIGVAQAPSGGTQSGVLAFFVSHPGLIWPADVRWTLFCN